MPFPTGILDQSRGSFGLPPGLQRSAWVQPATVSYLPAFTSPSVYSGGVAFRNGGALSCLTLRSILGDCETVFFECFPHVCPEPVLAK